MYSNIEVTRAFAEFQRLGAQNLDWPAWAALFTDDATYIEHCLGKFHGANAIRDWLVKQMEPVAPMTFSLDWQIVDPPYVAFNIWNHMPDPAGTGTMYSFSNLSLMIYAGNGKWRWEEDFYSPANSADTVMAWYGAGGRPTMAADKSITHVSLAAEPFGDDPDGVAQMVAAWRSGTPEYAVGARVWDQPTGWYDAADAPAFWVAPDVVVTDGKRAFLRCGNVGVALNHGGGGTIAFEERAWNQTEAPIEP